MNIRYHTNINTVRKERGEMLPRLNEEKLRCKFCSKVIEVSHRSYKANPYCNDKECYEKRLEASGAIDLRENYEIVNLGNGYVQINPVDSQKKWISNSKNSK